MGKNTAILFFSGTGNTAAVAGLLSSELERAGAAELIRIEEVLLGRAGFDASAYDLIGIGYPSYGFNSPPIVDEFVSTLKDMRGKDVFLFMTCAGPCYINDVAAYGLKRKLIGKGCRIVYEKVFVMPANVLIRYDDDLIKQLYNAAARKAKAMAEDLAAGRVSVREDGILPALFRWTYVYIERVWIPAFAKDFRVLKTCAGCRKCVRSCPRGNIELKDGRIRFGFRCAGCYRCVYGCPRRAIRGRLFDSAIFREFYDLGGIVRDESLRGAAVTKDTKGIFKTLYRYLSE